MSQGGFFEQKRASPTGFLLVVAGHLAVIGAVMLVKGPQVVTHFYPKTDVEFIELPKDPPEKQVEPPAEPPQRPTVIDTVPPVIPRPTEGPTFVQRPRDVPPPVTEPVGQEVIPPPADPPAPDPVRRDAQFDPRYAANLQPPYPASEQRAQRSGMVRLEVTIGTDGRVRAVRQISATSDAFWSAAQRHALSRWRFRPATVDDRPVESTKILTLYFRIEDA